MMWSMIWSVQGGTRYNDEEHKGLPAPVMRNQNRIFDPAELEEICQRSHMQFEVA